MTPEWGEVKAALEEWEAAKETEEVAMAEEAKKAEAAAKNTVCEWVVRVQQAEEEAQQKAAQAAQQECCICLESVAARSLLVLVPCGHRCVRAGCSGSLVGNPCPICRQTVSQAIRVYD